MESTFPKMAEVLPESEKGEAKIFHYEVSELDATRDSFHGMYTEPGKVAVLTVCGKTMMSDTHHERRSNSEVVWNAKGHVLIAGLGMGMILHPILFNPEVLSVTVIEKYQDVIDLVAHTLPHREKLTVICADIFDWKPQRGSKWDVIYFDIWADICTDNLKEIAKLHQKFKSYKASGERGGWMDSWCRDTLKYRKQQEKRQGW